MSDDEGSSKKKSKGKEKKEKPMSPQQIEAIASFDISKLLQSLELQDLVNIVQAYKQRTFDEDISLIEQLGGLEGISTKLKTSWQNGISAHSVEELNK